MVSTNREKNIDFYDEIFEIPWKVESPNWLKSVCYGLIWLAVTMTSDSWSLAADFWSKEKDQHSDGSKLLIAYTLTKKCTWNAPKIPFKCQFKKCMYQKIACVRISLIHLSHFYAWGRPFVFLLSAVCHILKNRLQYKSTKILHGHQWQVNFFISISVRTDLPNMLSHTVWFDLLIKEELRLKCDLLLISAVVTVKVRDLNFSDVVKPFLYSTWERSCPFISRKPPPRLKASL